MVYGNFDVEVHSHKQLVAVLELVVVVVSHTFDGRFADNVETFFVELAVDVAIEGLWDNLAEESFLPSYFVVKNMPIAFVWDLADNQTCVADS